MRSTPKWKPIPLYEVLDSPASGSVLVFLTARELFLRERYDRRSWSLPNKLATLFGAPAKFVSARMQGAPHKVDGVCSKGTEALVDAW